MSPSAVFKSGMDPKAAEFKPESAVILVQPTDIYAIAGDSCNSLLNGASKSMEWLPSTPVLPTKSKALAIRNPKTGEVIAAPVEQQSKARNALTAFAKTEWAATAEMICKRMRAQKLRPDHSTFSALNVDGLRKAPPKTLRHTTDVLVRPCTLLKENSPVGSSKITKVLPEVPFFNPNQKIPSTTAAILAALSLEPGQGKRRPAVAMACQVPSESSPLGSSSPAEAPSLASKRPWKPKRLQMQEDGSGEEPSTSAGSASANDISSDHASWGEPEPSLSGEDCGKEELHERSKTRISRLGHNKQCQKDLHKLLSFRFATSGASIPVELETLTVQEFEEGLQRQNSSSADFTRKSSFGSTAYPSDMQSDRAIFCSSRLTRQMSSNGKKTPNSQQFVLTPSAQAYRPMSSSRGPEEELKRTVQSLLNKVCPESVATICEKISEIKVSSTAELEIIIGLIFKKALSEPHYCETYADLVFGLKPAFPEFPSEDGGKPVTFKSSLLNICQNEFDSLPTTLAPSADDLGKYDAEELEFRRKKRKDRVLANMKLIGHLFLRQLLSAKVIGSIIQELTLCGHVDQVPEEHVLECAVELLMSIGFTLESMPAGKATLSQVCGRLKDLKQSIGLDGKPIYGKRIQFAIQDLLEVRQAGWKKKVFSGVAKTKEEIRLEQQKDLSAQTLSTGQQLVVAGQRPIYMAKRDS